MSEGAAGADLSAAIDEPIELEPGQRTAIATGLAFALPIGFEAQVRPRSGLALRQGLTVINSPGTIDCDYRGEVKVLIANLGDSSVTIEPGQRIAQLIIAPVVQAHFQVADELEDTARGDGGFGSTGEGGSS
jgi:dUTP pyrophosphatase